jgi:cellulose synthase/poly-beta-1,6-N-acetylglucosamine synthase-like glycosyltransferase
MRREKSKTEQYIEIAYLLLLFSTFGISIFLGIGVTSTIFGSEISLGEELLSNYQEGLIMTTIFIKFGYFLNFVAISVVLFEAWMWKNGERDRVIFSSAFTTVATALLFVHYYTPQVLEFQSLENTETEVFKNIHLASEIDFKIFAVAILVLGIKRIIGREN